MLGEKRMKMVFLCFWLLLLGKIGCLLGTSCVLFMDGDGGRDKWVASGVGALGQGIALDLSSCVPALLLVNHGTVTKLLYRKSLSTQLLSIYFFVFIVIIFKTKCSSLQEDFFFAEL